MQPLQLHHWLQTSPKPQPWKSTDRSRYERIQRARTLYQISDMHLLGKIAAIFNCCLFGSLWLYSGIASETHGQWELGTRGKLMLILHQSSTQAHCYHHNHKTHYFSFTIKRGLPPSVSKVTIGPLGTDSHFPCYNNFMRILFASPI